MRTVTLRNSTAPVVAVNDAVIPNTAIAREVQNHAAEDPRQAWQEATQALVVRELLLQRALMLGLAAEPRSDGGLRESDDEALIRALLETEVRTPKADDEVCHRYYQANRSCFRSSDTFEPLHILFQASRDDDVSYADALARAEAVLVELRAAPDRFESLARALSHCPSAGEGGRLGHIAPSDTTPEFEAALLTLEPGETCREPVQARYGVHVVRLDRKLPGQTLSFEQVRDRIAAYLEESSWRRGVAQYVALLAGQARITGFAISGASSPLVQ